MEKKILDKNFFTTIWSNWQAESSTDIWTDKISSKWHTKVAQCPMMKKKNFIKKNFFKKSSWIRGKQMWQICRLFFWQKKPLFLRSISEEHEKKTNNIFVKTMFCPQIFPLDTWKAVLLSWTKDFRKKTDKFLLNVRKWWRKNFRQTFFTRNWSNWQTENSTDIWTDKISSKWHTKVAQCPMMKKKNFIKKNFFKKSSWIRGKQMWQICRLFFWQKKPLFLRSISEEHEKKKQTTSLSKQCFVLKFFLWTRGKQFC